MDISVIVPVYNVEKYLVRCLDSICKQSFSGTLEVIAIDDASTDNSLAMLKEYAKTDHRIKVIEHEKNKKLSVARSTGMKAASGDYIMHVDSDDWLLPNALEILFQKSKKNNVDVLVFGFQYINKKGKLLIHSYINSEIITTDKLKVQNFFMGATISKFVRRELTEKMIYENVSINSGEDLLYSTEILLKANLIGIVDDVLYNYNSNPQSITNIVQAAQILNSRILLLQQIREITLKYKASSKFIENILQRFENIIISYSFQKWLYVQQMDVKTNKLIESFKLFHELPIERLNFIDEVLQNKRMAFYYTLKRFGIIYTTAILLKALLFRIK